MVTSYYIMKMSKNIKKGDITNIYSDNLFNTVSYFMKTRKKLCRVCLKEGNIPIYGNEESPDIPETLLMFGGIETKEDTALPNHLCKACYQFLKGAIQFRKIAKQTDEILKKSTQEELVETLNHTQELQDYGMIDDINETSTPPWDDEHSFSNLKEEKKEKKKHATKVTCNICNKVINRSYYKEHLTMHDPNHQKYVCEICGKFFRLRCAYHNHSLRHRNDFPYKCQICPYRGRYAELLKTHMRTHSGDYRYMCTECPARFLFKSNLNSHMLKHKEPQFKCDACKRAFHTKLMLQRHFEADHLGIKNHVCPMCGKAFGYRNAMMKHQRHVHKREKLLFGRMPSYLEAQHKQLGNV